MDTAMNRYVNMDTITKQKENVLPEKRNCLWFTGGFDLLLDLWIYVTVVTSIG